MAEESLKNKTVRLRLLNLVLAVSCLMSITFFIDIKLIFHYNTLVIFLQIINKGDTKNEENF